MKIKTSDKVFFKNFIADQKVLIADPNGSSRTGIARLLVELGAKTNNLILASSYHTGVASIQQTVPTVIFTEFVFKDGSGLDFFDVVRAQGKDPQTGLCVAFTQDPTQSALAEALEEQVDCFVLKPYTMEHCKNVIITAAAAKFTSSPYRDAFNLAKVLLIKGSLDEAFEAMERATSLNPRPSLAKFYLGEIRKSQGRFDEAEDYFIEGLSFNQVHYKCLTGLLDLFIQKKNFQEAYGILSSILKTFPVSPYRLSQFGELMVISKNYEKADWLYATFKEMNDRTPELVQVCCGAIIACGKHYLKSQDLKRGRSLLENAAISAAGNTELLSEIALVLIENKQLDLATEVLKRFPAESQDQNTYLIPEFILAASQNHDDLFNIYYGRKLIKRGAQDLRVYQIVITSLVAKEKHHEAEDLISEAQKLWPDQKELFSTLIPPSGSKKSEA